MASVKRTAASTEKYRAVKDYNPDQFSRSGHRRLELPLKEGDIVKVLGMLSFSEEKIGSCAQNMEGDFTFSYSVILAAILP